MCIAVRTAGLWTHDACNAVLEHPAELLYEAVNPAPYNAEDLEIDEAVASTGAAAAAKPGGSNAAATSSPAQRASRKAPPKPPAQDDDRKSSGILQKLAKRLHSSSSHHTEHAPSLHSKEHSPPISSTPGQAAAHGSLGKKLKSLLAGHKQPHTG